MYGLEEILPIEWGIKYLKLAIELLTAISTEEECFLHLAHLYATQRNATMANESHKKCIKAQYKINVRPHAVSEGDLAFLYDSEIDKLGVVNLEPMWLGPYIFKNVLVKGAYELIYFDKIPLVQPNNGLYLKKYYA